MEYWNNGKLKWCTPGDVAARFTRDQIIFCLEHWGDIELAMWPPPPYEEVPSSYVSRHAYFEMPTIIKLEIEERLKRCGRDGQMLKDRYALGKSDTDMELTYRSKYLRYLEEIEQRIGHVLGYISGKKRKRSSYRDWREHRRVEEPTGVAA